MPPSKRVATRPSETDRFLAAALYLAGRTDPTVEKHLRRCFPAAYELPRPLVPLTELVAALGGAPWPVRARIAAFVCEVPQAAIDGLSQRERLELARAPEKLGFSRALLDAVREYNHASSPLLLAPVRSRVHEVVELGAQLNDVRRRLLCAPPAPSLMLQIPAGVTPQSWAALERAITTSSDGSREVDGFVRATVELPFSSLRRLLRPLVSWKSCIRQVQDVVDLSPPAGQIREVINLLAPVPVGSGVLQCDLTTSLTVSSATSRRLNYSLITGTSNVNLAANEGYLQLTELVPPDPNTGNGGACLFVIDKRVRFASESVWLSTFDLNPDGLRDLLAYWIMDAQSNCG